jgi:peptidoglycan biosynthesis protein MviN/MurJ (putative lipid II flippase)
VFYSLGDTRTPVVIAAVDLGAFVLAALSLRGPLGHVGVSAAVTIASLVQACLLWVRLRKWLPDLRTREIAASALRTLAASAASAGLAWSIARGVARAGGSMAAQGAAGAVAGVLGFALAAFLVRSPELDVVLRRVRRQRS